MNFRRVTIGCGTFPRDAWLTVRISKDGSVRFEECADMTPEGIDFEPAHEWTRRCGFDELPPLPEGWRLEVCSTREPLRGRMRYLGSEVGHA